MGHGMALIGRWLKKIRVKWGKDSVVFDAKSDVMPVFSALQHWGACECSAALWDFLLFAFRASASKKQQSRGG
jgi:hypothetical protein